MLTFLSPRDRQLTKFLKPKAAFWAGICRTYGLVGGVMERDEHLEDLMRQEVNDYDRFGLSSGFEHDGTTYILKIQGDAGAMLHRECTSLLEVAIIVSLKFNIWTNQVLSNVPMFATAALNANSPSNFLNLYRQAQCEHKLGKLRRTQYAHLTGAYTEAKPNRARLQMLATVLIGTYDQAHIPMQNDAKQIEEYEKLGLDFCESYRQACESLRPVLLKDLELHRPHIFALLPSCQTDDEVVKLLEGNIGFLRARMALMSNEQRDYMFAGDVGV